MRQADHELIDVFDKGRHRDLLQSALGRRHRACRVGARAAVVPISRTMQRAILGFIIQQSAGGYMTTYTCTGQAAGSAPSSQRCICSWFFTAGTHPAAAQNSAQSATSLISRHRPSQERKGRPQGGDAETSAKSRQEQASDTGGGGPSGSAARQQHKLQAATSQQSKSQQVHVLEQAARHELKLAARTGRNVSANALARPHHSITNVGFKD
jgi:hypothetical protein